MTVVLQSTRLSRPKSIQTDKRTATLPTLMKSRKADIIVDPIFLR